MRRGVITQVAASVPFDNDTNGFVSTDTQAAIEETKLYGEGFPRAGIYLLANGVVSNNQWLSYTELLPNTPIGPFPVKLKINEIMWSNTNLNVSFNLEFYKNGTAVGDIFYTYSTLNDADGMGYVSGLSFTFDIGDYIKVRYKDTGTNVSDFALILWVSRIP